METSRRLALLIDADNAQATLIPQILEEVAKYGDITIRRAYGDWTTPQLGSWKNVMQTYALQPVQQFSNVSGKNATDSALIIDAMDIVYTADVGGVCIVSSDSDYTRLAMRIREKNLFVIGIGRSTTPISFVKACNQFIYTEKLQSASQKPTAPKKTSAPASPKVAAEPKKKKAANTSNSTVKPATEPKKKAPTDATKTLTPPVTETGKKKAKDRARLKELIQTAFASTVQDDGWAHLGAIGHTLQQLDPTFEPRTYGYKLLSQLVKDLPDFIELDKRRIKNSGDVIYVRLKKDPKPTK